MGFLDELYHYGTPRHSGRYPYGSGENPYQHESWFLNQVDDYRRQGLSETEIAQKMNMSTTEYRAKKSIALNEQRNADVAQALRLKDRGYSYSEIGRLMGKNESSVRSLLNPTLQTRSEMTTNTANILKENVEKKKYIDIGPGTEISMGVSSTKLKTAVEKLKDEGYTVHYIQVEQQGTGKKTTIKVLAAPGTTWKEVNAAKDNNQIKTVQDYTEDGGITFRNVVPPESVDSSRILIRYNEEGGIDKDGCVELRRGVEDISLGNSNYAQVRIAVDGTHYIKGMAMYSDDIPDGYDMVFNTNKHVGTPMKGAKDNTVLKPLKSDPDNPFGATIKPISAGGQRYYIGPDGEKHLSVINKVNDEGDWAKWSKTLSAQMLSKQSPSLAKEQLDIYYKDKEKEYNEIMKLTNPVVQKKLLISFADDCDASASHLKAAALPRQASHVILPFPNMKETDIYAPNYKDGERVVLIRYPHGGKFEIPELVVNNKNKEAKSILGNAPDAVGINPKVAARLSGADFDGDTVLVIPNNSGKVKTSKALEGLKDFDPKEQYPYYEGMKTLSARNKQNEMGRVTNLITDMTIRGATPDELARAVRHSMVIIDAEKHKLDYKRSYEENGIAALKKKYQGSEKAGASTLISRAGAETRVNQRKDRYDIDPETGKKIYFETGENYTVTTKTGKEKTIFRQQTSTQMAEVDNAYSLSSGTVIESIYANHANRLKTLANNARKASLSIKDILYSPSARKIYAKEVASLNSKLNEALKNKPLERQAQMIAGNTVKAARRNNPDMEADDIKKLRGQALAGARARVGAHKSVINISDKEWEAIQAGAVSKTTLEKILDNSNLDQVKQLATPRTDKVMSPGDISRARSLEASGRTQAEIADILGVSTTTLRKALAS